MAVRWDLFGQPMRSMCARCRFDCKHQQQKTQLCKHLQNAPSSTPSAARRWPEGSGVARAPGGNRRADEMRKGRSLGPRTAAAPGLRGARAAAGCRRSTTPWVTMPFLNGHEGGCGCAGCWLADDASSSLRSNRIVAAAWSTTVAPALPAARLHPSTTSRGPRSRPRPFDPEACTSPTDRCIVASSFSAILVNGRRECSSSVDFFSAC